MSRRNNKITLHISSHILTKELKNDFITEQSNDITDEIILYAINNINRPQIIIELNKIIANMQIATKIESSIFEYTLLHVMGNNLVVSLIPNIYQDKLCDIKINLQKSSTLLKNLQDGNIKPQTIAFLSPSQICPEVWRDLLLKMQKKAERENNFPTTDLYECRKCHQRKCIVRELQTRSADEPMTKFITCCNCYNTFTK